MKLKDLWEHKSFPGAKLYKYRKGRVQKHKILISKHIKYASTVILYVVNQLENMLQSS